MGNEAEVVDVIRERPLQGLDVPKGVVWIGHMVRLAGKLGRQPVEVDHGREVNVQLMPTFQGVLNVAPQRGILANSAAGDHAVTLAVGNSDRVNAAFIKRRLSPM
jgi:hypothetical protein